MGTSRDGLFECGSGNLQQLSERAGISDSAIEVLCGDGAGGLWIGTRNGGLNHIENRTVNRFNTPWGFLGTCASALERDSQGDLWIGTTGDGLFCLRKGQFTRYATASGLPSDQIRALHADGAGWIWVGTDKGLGRIRTGRVTNFTAATACRKKRSCSWTVTRRETSGSVPATGFIASTRNSSTPLPRGARPSSVWWPTARRMVCREFNACLGSNGTGSTIGPAMCSLRPQEGWWLWTRAGGLGTTRLHPW